MREQIFATVQKFMAGPFRHVGDGNVLTKCPFHKGGQEHKPSFSINIEHGVFNCFTCHVAGDISYLLKLLGLPRDRIDIELSSVRTELDKNRQTHFLEKQNTFARTDPFKADFILPEALLGVYEFMPLKLVEAGFHPDLLRDMEIGFDRNGNRIMYPLRDLYGNLAGFSGGAQTQEQAPKYKVYQGRRRVNNRWIPGDFGSWFDDQFPDYRCENHDFLWNYNRVYPRVLGMGMSDPNATVFIVEGFKACLWMLQAGYLNTVALMGSYISDRQQTMLHRLSANIVLFLDNDKAGREASVWVGDLLWKPMRGRVTVVKYPPEDDHTQPDDYFPEGIHQMVQSRVPLHQFQREQAAVNPQLKEKLDKKRSRPQWQ